MKIKQLIEAALFVSTEPITLDELKHIAGNISTSEIKQALDSLIKRYELNTSALEIRRIGNNGYIMQAKDAYSNSLIELVEPTVSREVLKTLSLIALKQPITQAEVVKSRGYSAYAHVKELLFKEFLLATPQGNTKILKTTKRFSDYFSLPNELLMLKKELANQLNIK
jgi:segregation and condensation protein B|tara:strand:+ start:751 stop:1254 length:504 start_codon:yes stop_codon:yes gene_type:complete